MKVPSHSAATYKNRKGSRCLLKSKERRDAREWRGGFAFGYNLDNVELMGGLALEF